MRLRTRTGFTLVEMMMAVTILTLMIAAATGFFNAQARAVAAHGGRFEAQQNGVFAISALDREIRMAGVGVLDHQPMLIEAGARSFTFNANLVSRFPGDPSAVYVDRHAPDGATGSLSPLRPVALPATAAPYPAIKYETGGTPSEAETISFYLTADSTTRRTDDFLLLRRVNAEPPAVVARSLLLVPGQDPFQYLAIDSTGTPQPVPPTILPLWHSAKEHGSPADTGRSAKMDSIYSVRVRLLSIFEDPRQGDVRRPVDQTIRLLNAGLIKRSTCGEQPLPVPGVSAANGSVGGMPAVQVTWSPSGDETTGEKDVEGYALYRRPAGAAEFGDSFANVAAGKPGYQFVDTDVAPGEAFTYAVAAQDCTPQMSGLAMSNAVVVTP